MTREEMKKKIYEIVLAELQNQFGCGDTVEVGDREVCAEAVADALIAAGIGDVNATKEKFEGYYYFEVAREKQRAERAERALINEIKSRIKMTGDNASLVYVYYGHAINQAEKELEEERKDEKG